MQRLQEQEILQQKEQEKIVSGIQLNWAKKPMEPRKQLAESRLQKEKEPPQVVTNTSSSIWNGQNLTWATASAQSTQWSATSVAVAGFWEPSTVSKSNSTNNFQQQQQQQQAAKQKQQQQQAKAKAKKEEAAKANHNNNNGPASDEFTTWCYKTLSNISTNVDIPTFVSFLRDIESAFDVREYCKEYLGESGATHQFASSFLERRRQCRPQRRDQHKDDMCVPAPAITPQGGHTTGMGEFQEVKGKNKKNKKSKMLKVDSRILGFNVTSAPDRINVGDRDYGDNS
nr:unnamed protein product [Callosobruchus chinensis]